MDVFYINLAGAYERRQALEANFASVNALGWRLHRVEAVPVDIAATHPGRLRDSEKSCFLSHTRAAVESCATDGHAFIIEDDVLFGKNSQRAIECALNILPETDWDIIYADICVPTVDLMMTFFRGRARIEDGKCELVKLSNRNFAGAAAYVINRHSKARLAELWAQHSPMKFLNDLYLRDLIHANTLRGYVIFPFATTLARLADHSQIQQAGHAFNDFIWNEFRRLMWIDRDPYAVMESVQRLGPNAPDAEAFSKLMAAMLRPSYVEIR